MADWNALRDWTRATAGLELTDAAVDRLQHYTDLLQLWNRKVALVADAAPQVVLHKHVADSLFTAAHCRNAAAVADLGSGAGFPGLVIAIAWPHTRVTLIEARGKKVSFLEEVRRVAAIDNAEPIHGRIEAVSWESRHRAAYDVVTSRALADIAALRTLAAPLAAKGCRLLAMRAATAALPPAAEVERVNYTLPDGTPRSLVTIRL